MVVLPLNNPPCNASLIPLPFQSCSSSSADSLGSAQQDATPCLVLLAPQVRWKSRAWCSHWPTSPPPSSRIRVGDGARVRDRPAARSLHPAAGQRRAGERRQPHQKCMWVLYHAIQSFVNPHLPFG